MQIFLFVMILFTAAWVTGQKKTDSGVPAAVNKISQ